MNYEVTGVLTDDEKLEALSVVGGWSLDDRYWCLHCGLWHCVRDVRFFHDYPGELIEVARGLGEYVSPAAVFCANRDCDGSLIDMFPWDIVEDLDEAGNPFDRKEWERVNYWEAEDVGT